MEIVKKAKDFKALSRVVKRTDLVSVVLLSCNVSRNLGFFQYESVRAEISFDATLFEEYDDHFVAKAHFSAKGLPEDEQDDEELVSIEGEYIITYTLRDKDPLTKDDLENFCKMNAIYNAWPYWREFVQNITNRMELPTLTIPLLKFRQPPKKEEEGDKTKKD